MAYTRRIWWLLFLTILAITVGTLVVAGAGAPGDEGNGSPAGDGIWETDGDWTVEEGEDLSYESLTIMVNGNISVEFGGKLTLTAVKMVMNCSEDLEFHISVGTGGELVATDLDGDSLTTSDRTELRSYWQTSRYTILIDGGAKVSILYSSIADIGNVDTIGLSILSDDVLFESSILTTFSGIYVDGASPVFRDTRLTGNLVSRNYFLNSGAEFTDCKVTNCYYGINVKGTPSPTLAGTDVANCFIPINLEGTHLYMTDGLIEAALYGTDVQLNQSSRLTLTDVTFDASKVVFLDQSSWVDVRWTLTLRVTDQAYNPLSNASVEVNDTLGETVFDGKTNATGMVVVDVLEGEMNATLTLGHNPYSVRVEKDRYHALVSVNVTSTMTREVTVLTNLAPIISVSSPLPGTRVVMDQELLFDASASYDPNGDPMTFRWTTNIAGRLIYAGPLPVITASLRLGESEVTLTVSDGEGGINTSRIPVQVLQASQQTLTVTKSHYIAKLEASYGGTGQVKMDEAMYPKPYPPELIGIFLKVHYEGDAIFAIGEMEISYSTDLLPYGMDESTLFLAVEDGGLWVPVAGSSVDVDAHEVTATVTSFGMYAVRGLMPENVPPRLLMQVGDQLVQPSSVDIGPLEPIVMVFVVQDELPAFARLEVVDMPDFLHLDSTTKLVTGTSPANASSYLLVLRATDIGGLTNEVTIHLNVTHTVSSPQLWSGIIDPSDGYTSTSFEISVVYVSPGNRAPEYVIAVFEDNDTVELTPVNITDDEYRAGVMYHAFVRLSEGKHDLWFETFDGIHTNRTVDPLRVEVDRYGIQVSDQEWAIIIVTLIATIIIILIIRETSDRYKRLKETHFSKDREDRVEYIEPGKAKEGAAGATEGERAGTDEEDALDEDEAEPVTGDDGQVHELKVDDEEMHRLDEDVDRLDDELAELDGAIDEKEDDLARIDEEIEEIIDELEDDRSRIE